MTSSNMERKVLRGLEPHQFKSHLFLYRDNRGRERILFSGYVMAYVNNSNWHNLFRIPGVVRVLMNGDVPSLLPGRVMVALREREDAQGYMQLPERFELNQKLRVQNGPFQNQIVLYRGMSAEQREMALLSMLGREIVAEFNSEDLAPIHEESEAA